MKKAIAAVLIGMMASCGGGNLSFSVRAGTTASTVAGAPQALSAGTGIVVTRLRVVIGKLQLEKAGTTEMDEDASGPFLLDLSGATLDGGVSQVLEASVTPGTYSEIELEIHKPESGETAANADLQEMITRQASIIADGTIDGAPFSFATSVTAEQKFEGNVELKDGSNLTLNVDASSWFTSGSARLDPRNESNRSQIENNIQNSFKAFQDDNHDGRDDN
jgi:hypothetical protein